MADDPVFITILDGINWPFPPQGVTVNPLELPPTSLDVPLPNWIVCVPLVYKLFEVVEPQKPIEWPIEVPPGAVVTVCGSTIIIVPPVQDQVPVDQFVVLVPKPNISVVAATLFVVEPPLFPSIVIVPPLWVKLEPLVNRTFPLTFKLPPVIVKVPPELTTNVLLNWDAIATESEFAVILRVPDILKVLLDWLASKSITWVAAITTSLTEVGTAPPTHVEGEDQFPELAEVIVCACTLIAPRLNKIPSKSLE